MKLLYESKTSSMIQGWQFIKGEVVEVTLISLIPGKEGSFNFMNRNGIDFRLKANEFLNKFTLDRETI